jgi:hypothetical protein
MEPWGMDQDNLYIKTSLLVLLLLNQLLGVGQALGTWYHCFPMCFSLIGSDLCFDARESSFLVKFQCLLVKCP